jgi:hypothetical protein
VFAKLYDVFLIDESIKTEILRAGGRDFLDCGDVVFVPNLASMST